MFTDEIYYTQIKNVFKIVISFNSRFKHKNPEDPAEVPGGYLSDCREDTLNIVEAYADQSIKSAKVYDKFQFERIGFFSVDPDTTSDKVSCIIEFINSLKHLLQPFFLQ